MDHNNASDSSVSRVESLQEQLFRHREDVRRGGGTIILIGIATFINIALAYFEVDLFFPIGLYYPIAVVDLWPSLSGLVVTTVVCALLYLMLGRMARGGSQVACNVALILYGIDTVIPLVYTDWIGVGLHAFFLFSMFGARGKIELVKDTEELLQRQEVPAPEPTETAVPGT